jgi:excisionase family DNA binding protein
MSHSNASIPQPFADRYMSAPEAAHYIRLSLSFLRKATMNGEIPHAKVGVRVVYDRLDLDRFIEQRKVATAWDVHDRRRA